MKMSSLNFECLWILMSKYTFQMESESTNEDLLCVICNKIMIDACQSICGCRYCNKCINAYLSEESEYCPGNKDDCKEEKLVFGNSYNRNILINKKISKVKVHCPNESCSSIEELTNIESHLRICTKQISECPYVRIGCGNLGAKDRMLSHLTEHTWQHTHLLINYVENVNNEKGSLKEDLEMCKREITFLNEDSRKKDGMMKEHGTLIDSLLKNVEELREDLKEKETHFNKEIEWFTEELNKRDKVVENQKTELEVIINDESIQRESMMTIINEIKEESNLRETQMMESIQELKDERIYYLEEDLKTTNIEIKNILQDMAEATKFLDGIKEQSTEIREELWTIKEECMKCEEETKLNINNLKEESKRQERKLKEQERMTEKECKDIKYQSTEIKVEVENLKKDCTKYLKKTNSILSALKEESDEKDIQIKSIIQEITKGMKWLEDIKEQSTEIKDDLDTLEKKSIIRQSEMQTDFVIFKNDSNQREKEIMTVLQDMTTSLEDNKEQSKKIQDKVETLNEESKKDQKETTSNLLSLVNENNLTFEKTKIKIDQFIQESKNKFDCLNQRIDIIYIKNKKMEGEILFKADRFSVRKSSKEVVYSPYFYSHLNGYKLRLQVHPGGYDGKCTHLSVYFVICKGEYDDDLHWPCLHSIKISVINQSEGCEHMSVTKNHSSAIINKHSFNKPSNEDNVGYGSPNLITHWDLQNIPGLVVNDCVLIKCTVSAPL